jgi:GLPGLI family protein
MLEGLKENGSFKRMYTEAVNNAKYLRFNLAFNGQNSVFSLNNGLVLGEENNTQSAIIASGYKGTVYQSKESSYSEIEKGFGNYLLINEPVEWVLTNETKEIEGFLCYKATAVKIIINSSGTFKHPIIAWFCPKIPLTFGPNGYGKLPGLILELQVRNVLYGIKKMDLNLAKDPELTKMKNYKIVTEKELEDIMEKKFRKNNY